MKWSPWLVVLLVAASCAAPEPPEAWSVERVTPTSETEVPTGVCEDVRALALGAFADDPEIDATLDELGRIAAASGATDALPALNEFRTLDTDPSLTPHEISVRRHDLLVTASQTIDASTAGACGVPAFSALYATSGFPDCHFEMEIPIAAYTPPGRPGTCTADGHPDFLPCWTDDADHLAVDCVSGEIVTAVNERWDPAGPPRVVQIDRTDPDAEPGPEIVALNPAPECADLATLFRTDAPASSDLERLPDATASLSVDIRNQVAAFIAASADPPTLDEFETLVFELDRSTAAACGLPLVSAWATLTDDAAVLPCWTETGLPYPAYETVACE